MAAVAVRETAARVPDATGVGAAVVDMLRDAGLRFVSVTITASEEEVGGGGTYRVPKRDLIAAPQVLLQCRRVRIAAALPEAETLAAELRNFRYEVTRAGRDTYAAWREGDHDDLVLAVALAVWATQKAQPPRRPIRTPERVLAATFRYGGSCLSPR